MLTSSAVWCFIAPMFHKALYNSLSLAQRRYDLWTTTSE
jgi:hypothetical protein